MNFEEELKRDRKKYFESENYLSPENGYPERDISWFQNNILNNFLNLDFVKNSKNLVDVGCAFGYFTKIFSNHFEFTLGIDFAENRISYAKNHENEKLIFRQQDLTSSNFNLNLDKKFDLLFTNAVFPHIPLNLKVKAFENLSKISNPGARLVMYDGLCSDGCLDQFVGLFSIDWLKTNLKSWKYISHEYVCEYTYRIILEHSNE
jgi:2-polyprenyl-3-methyl-5-hydroxy-6-metoxy-1,4-benzoquinol methylase